MKDKKMVLCILTGVEIPKRKSKLVLGHRVCADSEEVAKCLLIDATGLFLKNWTAHNKSAENRKDSLMFAVTMLKACVDVIKCEPTIFIVELTKQAEELGDPIAFEFSEKLFKFIGGKYIKELDSRKTQRAIRAGVEAFREQWDNNG